ncbi:gag-polyprotein putative aspartyl protease [Saccharicrinis carchari]|uniref:Gag-polyprotein putative aspartyl protease n=1 Tax=Saccharicrinis carchari TaxID=1168039 RepID=A0A521DFP1_SACCC|nr:retroviral-like aspartic protease family protein [Saccharicrinis carchari]SMO70539.1 gag-polyprotein putative aspartyl protease [Saccharicrinis carchari]
MAILKTTKHLWVNLCISLSFVILFACTSGSRKQPSAMTFQLNNKTDTIPLIFNQEGTTIFTKCIINGKQYTFGFDTGADGTMINTNIPSHDLKKNSVFEDIDGNTFEAAEVLIDNFMLSEIEFSNCHFLSYPIRHYDGLLGGDILENLIWKIDFANKHIQITDSIERFKPKLPGIPFRLKNKRPVITVQVNGIETDFIIDTGLSGFALINKDQSALKNKLHHLQKWDVLGKNAGNNIFEKNDILYEKQVYYSIAGLEVANHAFEDEMIQINSNKDNVLGLDFLKRFNNVIIDYINQRIYFGEKQQYKTTDYYKNINYVINSSGVGISNYNTQPIISHLRNNLEPGISLGDTVLVINNNEVYKRNESYFHDRWVEKDNSYRFVASNYRKIMAEFYFQNDYNVITVKGKDSVISQKLKKQKNIELPDTFVNYPFLIKESPLFDWIKRQETEIGEYYLHIRKRPEQ